MLELKHECQLLIDFKMTEAACQLDACLWKVQPSGMPASFFFEPDSKVTEKGAGG